jgi:3',5'-cyclic AMP phosphodiesterase CpdA
MNMRKHALNAIWILLAFTAWAQNAPPVDVKLPLQPKSVRFAVIGDSGTGDREQYDVARLLDAYRQKVNFDFVIMLGDNIYGSHSAADFAKKFEQPYKPLLDAGVKFYASLGNHDDPDVERRYKPFNMNGERYYKFSRGSDVDFFVLDSNYMDPTQLKWVGDQLQGSKARWKIAYFHHPLYNFGKHHGPDVDLRTQLAPLFQKFGVNVVFSGHEHVYERIKPVDNIYYFVMGSSGKLMKHDLNASDQMVKSFDTEQGFMVVEIAGDQLYFQTISRGGQTIDSGSVPRQNPKPATTTAAQ